MLNVADMQRLVDMQHRSYLLLKWMAKAVLESRVNFETVHEYSTLPQAAEGWMRRNYLNIPEEVRPPLDNLPAFCGFYSTYLTNSFDLIGDPVYLPRTHCLCPWCSWVIEAPRLKAKKLTSADKRRAQTMRINEMSNLVAQSQLQIGQDKIEEMLTDRPVFEDASLVAYGYDLLRRERGIASGPAVLALWRGFAWNAAGSPHPGFRLEADLIIEAENRLVELLRACA